MEALHLDQVIAALVFVGTRIGSLMMFPPFLGGNAIPLPVKAGLTLALTALLFPVVGIVGIKASPSAWVRVMASEMVIGLLLGLALQFVFEAVQFAGQVVGVQTGFSLITLLDPQTQADTPVLSIFQQLVALLIFFQLNVHHWLLRGLAASFSYLPPGSPLATGASTGGLVQAVGGIWLVGMEIAAPVVVATLVTDVALGFLGKASPQLPVVFVGLSVKNLLGLAVLAGSLVFWPRTLERHFTSAIGLGEHLLHLAK
jgi:flagellar biosynthesis protein FliR